MGRIDGRARSELRGVGGVSRIICKQNARIRALSGAGGRKLFTSCLKEQIARRGEQSKYGRI
ncbi:hypothetical protein D5b_00298 [Faustovirus]|nr:hypothetical protein D5b_00298 [Faustovirus]AMN84614.1 hypothetical protein D6_00211 [Faustovirus]AMP44246.1 hypothetical protein PRJ_Dakar_00291 [Faustovirus]